MSAKGQGGWQTAVLGLIAAGSIANALWMLAAPMQWFTGIPAGVPDYGPFNLHFVRDVGCGYLAMGLTLAWAAAVPSVRLPLTLAGLAFYGFHALLHVHDTGRGLVGPEHWLMDLPAIYLPAALLLAVAWTTRGPAR